MYDFFKKLQKDNSELEVLGTGRQIRDYSYISDTVKAFEIVAEKENRAKPTTCPVRI